ncbi:hypothetical protein IFM53868_00397 [Aspergillus udagawae]|uniref:Terpene synthase n=1 Tax=Aspergillus udagawae TaxID=91492 RepID=A0ABQ1A0R8_9EURO|nr:hypothetical protein IFM53868_00397 [Aspergillus udagawae]GFG15668.1 hypothetical protein IFM5058_07568 [Aspergillus udagawae]
MSPSIQMPSFANDLRTKSFMPISHIYDPIQTSNDSAFDRRLFAFLEATNGDGDVNSIPLSPSVMGIPWPSKFPGCRQCKHWETAERMTKELLHAIYQNYEQGPQDDGKLPVDLQKTSTDKRSLKENELVATAVKSTVYMFPDASPVRAGMIAQSMLLIFLHDDVVEESPVDAGSTITDAIVAPWIGTKDKSAQHPLHDFLNAVIDEEPILGKNLLAGAFAWIKHTKGYQSIPPTVFDSLRNYLDYRSVDIGRELLLAQAAFACNVHLSEPEMKVFDKLVGIYSDHISLTNDLYSFDKEYSDYCRTGAVLLNAVDVVRKVHRVSDSIAKQLVRESILETESEFSEEFKRLKLSGDLSDGQQRFIEALTLCLVGHIFYSATSGRYGGASASV